MAYSLDQWSYGGNSGNEGWGWPQWLTMGGVGLGAIGDIIGANTGGSIDLPSFAGGGYMSQAQKMMQPQLQAALSRSSALGAQEQAALGANLAQMGVSGGSKLQAVHNMVRSGQAQRDMQAFAQWQSQINNMAMQLAQMDWQRRISEYEGRREGGGFGGALSQIGQTAASVLPFVFL